MEAEILKIKDDRDNRGHNKSIVSPEWEAKRPLVEHLEELRRRLLRGLLWVACGTGASFHLAPFFLSRLIEPVGEVVFLSPVEPFLVTLKVAFLGGLFLSAPLLAWEAWGFFRPALFPYERRALFLLVPLSTALFFLGGWFGWKILLPAGLKLLSTFGAEGMRPMITVDHYLRFAGWLLIGCGLIFEMPMAILFFTSIGWLKPKALLAHWRLAVVMILLAAALLTPTPDAVTQLLLALPMAALYLLSVALALCLPKRGRVDLAPFGGRG